MLRQKNCKSALAFYLLLGLLSLYILAKLFIPQVRQVALKQFHLTNSFYLWAPLQVAPAMYNYANEFWFSSVPLSEQMLNKPNKRVAHHWTNHYPLRILTFHFSRKWFMHTKGMKYVTVRSRFRGTTEISRFELIKSDNSVVVRRISP